MRTNRRTDEKTEFLEIGICVTKYYHPNLNADCVSRFPKRQECSLLQSAQTASGAHGCAYSVGTCEIFPEGIVARD